MRAPRGSSAAAFAAAIALAACAGVAPRLEPPEVRGAALQVLGVQPPEVRFAVVLLLHNPNPVAVGLSGLDAAFSIEGEPVGDARLSQPMTLPANAETTLRLDARVDLSAAMRALGRTLGAGRPELRYEVSGTVALDDGRRFPFVRRGTTAGSDSKAAR